MPTERHTSPSDPARLLRQGFRDALTTAMKARDRVAVSALRSTLAALDNAEAVDRPAAAGGSVAIELIPVGVGATEVARRVLTQAQVERIVRAEVAERESAAGEYDRAGRPERAEELRGQARVIADLLAALNG